MFIPELLVQKVQTIHKRVLCIVFPSLTSQLPSVSERCHLLCGRWHSGENTRLPPMWSGFDSRTRRHMRVEFVVGSRPCSERFFSGLCGFPTFPNPNSIWRVSPSYKAHLIFSSWNYALHNLFIRNVLTWTEKLHLAKQIKYDSTQTRDR